MDVMNTTLNTFFSDCQARIETLLDEQLPPASNKLNIAIRYSTLNGGKRFRPALAYAIARYANKPYQTVDAIALALELIHCYSLVHDDLPAMDNDELRRGKPTCHIEFDEATAILVGDALQPLAFELIAQSPASNDTKIQLISQLAKASGAQGMVLGQSLDMEAAQTEQTLEEMQTIHNFKTGQLISASVLMPALALGFTKQEMQHLEDYSQHLGIMFQISDDILDVVSDTQTLGKPQGSDAHLDKSTYVSLLGLVDAHKALEKHYEQALNALNKLSNSTSLLEDLLQFVLYRNK